MKNFSNPLMFCFNSTRNYLSTAALLIIICVLTGASVDRANAQVAGIWDSYIILGPSSTNYFLGTSNSSNPSGYTSNALGATALNGANLGSFASGSTFNIDGGMD